MKTACLFFVGLFSVTAMAQGPLETCQKALRHTARTLPRFPQGERVLPLLKAVDRHCREALPGLSDAARRAVRQPWEKRVASLAEGAAGVLPKGCGTLSPLSPASQVSAECPRLEASEAFKASLDAGSWLFAVALTEAFRRGGEMPDELQRLLLDFLLSAALEKERREGPHKP